MRQKLVLALLAILGWIRPGLAEDQAALKLGMLPKLMGIPYFKACQQGAVVAAKELHVDLVFDGPTLNDSAKQSEYLDLWISRKFDIIAVATNDKFAIGPALKKAARRGVTTLTWDSDADPQQSQRQFFVNQADNQAIGYTLVDLMAQQIGGKGKVGIVTGSLTAGNQNIWMEFMRKRIKEKYPEMVEVPLMASEEDQQLAFQKTQDMIKANPDLKGIFGITSVALPGAAEAVKQGGYSGKIAVTGLALPTTMRPFLKSDPPTVKQFVLWNPVDLGYLTVYAAVAAKKGELKPGPFKAGRLGAVTVRGDEVMLGPPLVFSATNIDQFNF